MSRYTLPFLGTTRPNPGTNEQYDTGAENASFDQIDLKLGDHASRITSAENRVTQIESRLTGSLRVRVATDAQRLAAFPNPKHGDVVERTDKPYDERYLSAYNATTNIHGTAATPGWYPYRGGPQVWVFKASDRAQTLTALSPAKITWSAPPVTDDPFKFWSTAFPTRLTAPITGLYLFRGKMRTSGVTVINATLKRNNVLYERVHASNSGTSGASSSVYIEGEVNLAAGQYIELEAVSPASYIIRNDAQATWASLDYVRPY